MASDANRTGAKFGLTGRPIDRRTAANGDPCLPTSINRITKGVKLPRGENSISLVRCPNDNIKSPTCMRNTETESRMRWERLA